MSACTMSACGRLYRCAIFALIILAAGLAATAAVGAESGRTVPRFASLRADEVNVRTGPGVRYPVEWVFARLAMPVEITADFDTWRKNRDWQDPEGWVHQSMLSGRRTVIIVGQVHTLRRAPSADAPAVAHAEPGVIGKLLGCDSRWCRIEIAGYKGWLRRGEIWGVYPDEIIE